MPVALTALLARGSWPRNSQEAIQQNLVEFISSHFVREIAADEAEIHLYSPPFSSVREASEASDRSGDFWQTCGALEDIEPEKTVIIGDFGLGSDSPIVLYYRLAEAEPEVWRLRWAEPWGSGNYWQLLAATFSEFAERLGLARLQFGPATIRGC
jgi:hypothetical protein